MKKYSFKAVILDLDGIVTQTAILHLEAWKAVFDEYLRLREKRDGEVFQEFTHEKDYLPYVDGKPRYQGVKSFLESRGINIPFGEPTDPPDKETICGIGNKKNKKFVQLLKTKGAKVYPSTIELVKGLKQAGIKVGVASSSKNCEAILESVGIEELFETRVDGIISEQLGLKGKPEADIFVTAVKNLGLLPAEAVIVEDASSGVQAGRNGGFGLVLGVARKDNERDLLLNGADVAVKDLGDISIEWIEKWFHKRPRELFRFWESSDNCVDLNGELVPDTKEIKINPVYFCKAKDIFLSQRKLVFFLDYDGTLTPIVERPELAILSEEMRDILRILSQRFILAIVSGRSREDVEKLVDLEGIFYAGNHGFEIKGPQTSMILPEAEKVRDLIREVKKQLENRLNKIPGILIEPKKFSVAIHYRLVKEEKYFSEVEDFVNEIVTSNKFRLLKGKKVFEILPEIDWNKGKAIKWILEVLGISWKESSVVYIGDDTTDEDAFRVVRTRGTGILVSEKLRESAADFWVENPEEVKKLFKMIIGI